MPPLWTTSLVKPSPVYTTRTSRPWRRLDVDEFRAALMSSSLCRPDAWIDLDTDALACLYDVETTAILDRLVPARTVTCRRRSSDPWFDEECRLAKRRVRQLERAARSTSANSAAAAAAEWTAERRAYRALLHRKREAFGTSKVDSERASLRQQLLWRSIDALMGRGEFHRPRTLAPRSSSDISMRRWPTSTLTPRLHRSHLLRPAVRLPTSSH